ncbi:MAG: DUF2924 domain-containing protein [Rhodospirillaceae bacterium]|nr:DUF2924 domain-containing protein [Rhodospirillaceae bacterium]MBL6930335.1 DUF2924 domain-containing protein [Rhodospirillales bacterium]
MTDLSVETIENLERKELVTLWKELLSEPVPRRASVSFMRHVLAFEVQSRRYGKLPTGFIDKLKKQAKGGRSNRSKIEPKPGGRLLREWNGITHVVDVEDGQYVWNGQSYRSLSAIARTITGAHWSGPRFFGLTGAKNP